VRIDLNADLGEGCGNDEALLELVTSANIACGAHAGDDETMRATIAAALHTGAAIGAHPSYPDRQHFGRIAMERTPDEIESDVREQLERIATHARALGTRLTHVKAHGALYNVAAREGAVADAISRAVRAFDPALALVGLAGGEQLVSARDHGLRAIAEVFADRRYRPDGSLVPRSEPGALIDDAEEAVGQALRFVEEGRGETICLHGDGAHALAFARALRAALHERHIEIRSFTA
jgi:UPF0271 protein